MAYSQVMNERLALSPLLRCEFLVGSVAFLVFLVALRVAVLQGSSLAAVVTGLAAVVGLAAVGRLIVSERRSGYDRINVTDRVAPTALPTQRTGEG